MTTHQDRLTPAQTEALAAFADEHGDFWLAALWRAYSEARASHPAAPLAEAPELKVCGRCRMTMARHLVTAVGLQCPDGAGYWSVPAAPSGAETPTRWLIVCAKYGEECYSAGYFASREEAAADMLFTERHEHGTNIVAPAAPVPAAARSDVHEGCGGKGCPECSNTGRWYHRVPGSRARPAAAPEPGPDIPYPPGYLADRAAQRLRDAEVNPQTPREQYLVNRLRTVEAILHEYERYEGAATSPTPCEICDEAAANGANPASLARAHARGHQAAAHSPGEAPSAPLTMAQRIDAWADKVGTSEEYYLTRAFWREVSAALATAEARPSLAAVWKRAAKAWYEYGRIVTVWYETAETAGRKAEAARAAAERRLALALMELGKVPDPRVAELRGVDVRSAVELAAGPPRAFVGKTRDLTDAEVAAALARATPRTGQEGQDK